MVTRVSTERNANFDRQSQATEQRDADATIVTLSAAHDEQQLRVELLRMILKNEARRRGDELFRSLQDTVTTEGSASRQVEAAKS